MSVVLRTGLVEGRVSILSFHCERSVNQSGGKGNLLRETVEKPGHGEKRGENFLPFPEDDELP